MENYRENGFSKLASEVKLYEVETIKEFINWAKKTAPAENYILIPTNHGGGFDLDGEEMPENEAQTRAIAYDDNQHGIGVPTKAFAQALKETNTHLKAVYWNGCMMSQLEVMTEIAPYCDYQFGGAHVQRALPRHSYAIVEALNTYPDNFEQAALRQSEILNGPETDYDYGLSDVQNRWTGSLSCEGGRCVAKMCSQVSRNLFHHLPPMYPKKCFGGFYGIKNRTKFG